MTGEELLRNQEFMSKLNELIKEQVKDNQVNLEELIQDKEKCANFFKKLVEELDDQHKMSDTATECLDEFEEGSSIRERIIDSFVQALSNNEMSRIIDANRDFLIERCLVQDRESTIDSFIQGLSDDEVALIANANSDLLIERCLIKDKDNCTNFLNTLLHKLHKENKLKDFIHSAFKEDIKYDSEHITENSTRRDIFAGLEYENEPLHGHISPDDVSRFDIDDWRAINEYIQSNNDVSSDLVRDLASTLINLNNSRLREAVIECFAQDSRDEDIELIGKEWLKDKLNLY